MTVDILPDDVLLEIFSLFLAGKLNTVAWRRLVHVCQRWRALVFASARYLDIRLVCRCTPRTRLKEILAAWSTLLVVQGYGSELERRGGADNIIAALKHKTYVCQIDLIGHSRFRLRRIAKVMVGSFPALTHLEIRSLDVGEAAVVPVFPDDFLGGSAPSLRSCYLKSIAFPGIWKLLLTADSLVSLCLERVPSCTYISSEALVNILSALSHLQRFTLEFQSPRPRESIQFRPPETRVVLPSTLTYICVHGDCEYIEDLCSRIYLPIHAWYHFTSFKVDSESRTLQIHNLIKRASGHSRETDGSP